MTIEAIADGHVVTMHYTLRDPDGEIIDSSQGSDPLAYLHGANNIVPGLEKELTGKKVGDKVQAVVAPADGYGEPSGNEEKVPRSAFEDGSGLEAGMQVFAQTPDGKTFALWVVGVDDESVTVSADHPLAGVTLHFDIEITEVRAASDEEKAHGHPHGPGGHDH
jgi:FKBP-type peptidyl-prolyl cis-trans isomerase SlyD